MQSGLNVRFRPAERRTALRMSEAAVIKGKDVVAFEAEPQHAQNVCRYVFGVAVQEQNRAFGGRFRFGFRVERGNKPRIQAHFVGCFKANVFDGNADAVQIRNVFPRRVKQKSRTPRQQKAQTEQQFFHRNVGVRTISTRLASETPLPSAQMRTSAILAAFSSTAEAASARRSDSC